jgi:ElaB/YqjD/DUF883 family membrane-anchored ribosome-binding protein
MEQEERLTRIENVMSRLVDRTNRLDEVMLTLAESHIKLIERLDRAAQESEERDRRLGERIEAVDRTLGERIEAVDRRLGERIEALVSAMGEFIRNRPTTG